MTDGQLKAVFLKRGSSNYAVHSWLKAQRVTAVVPLRLGSRQRRKWERSQRSDTTTHALKDPRPDDPPIEVTNHRRLPGRLHPPGIVVP